MTDVRNGYTSGYTYEEYICNHFDEIFDRIAEVVGSKTGKRIGEALGVKQQTVSASKTRKQIPANWITTLACKYNVSPNWILFGIEPKYLEETLKNIDQQNASLVSIYKYSPGSSNPETISSPTTDYYLVPKVKARLNAGTGSLETEGQIVGKYAFRLDWIHSITTSPKSLVLMDVFGDSMEPEIKDGDTVMVDQSQKEIILGKIYAVGFGEEIAIKQVYKEPNSLILKSINPQYRPIELPANEWKDLVRIIGRVVWWCREG